MSLDALRDALPAYARDLAANLSVLAGETVLTEQQKWGCFLACACAVGEPTTVREIAGAARLDAAAATAAKSAAAIMGMNNVYYRALHLMKTGEYAALPSRLRMQVLADPGVDKADYELWSLAVSAVNGCGLCLDAHEEELRRRAVQPPQVQAALRIAAVVGGVAQVLRAEAALKDGADGASR